MVNSDILVNVVEAEDLTCNKLHIILVFFFDVILHRIAEYFAFFTTDK